MIIGMLISIMQIRISCPKTHYFGNNVSMEQAPKLGNKTEYPAQNDQQYDVPPLPIHSSNDSKLEQIHVTPNTSSHTGGKGLSDETKKILDGTLTNPNNGVAQPIVLMQNKHGDSEKTPKVTREKRWLELANGERKLLPKEMIDHINRHKGKNITKRFGQELAHKPKKSSAQGYDYSEAIPKTTADHRGIEHRYLKESKTGTVISIPRKNKGDGKLSLPKKGMLP